jgi:hypothetical protein
LEREDALTSNQKNDDNHDDDDDDEDILKIDSNYNEAIEEALNQKLRIRKNFLNKKIQAEAVPSQTSRTTNRKTISSTDVDEEIRRIEDNEIDDVNDSIELSLGDEYSCKKETYFPKSN